MQELSLNVLDIAQNSIRAGANLIQISVLERTEDAFLEISISDNGCGMTPPNRWNMSWIPFLQPVPHGR